MWHCASRHRLTAMDGARGQCWQTTRQHVTTAHSKTIGARLQRCAPMLAARTFMLPGSLGKPPSARPRPSASPPAPPCSACTPACQHAIHACAVADAAVVGNRYTHVRPTNLQKHDVSALSSGRLCRLDVAVPGAQAERPWPSRIPGRSAFIIATLELVNNLRVPILQPGALRRPVTARRPSQRSALRSIPVAHLGPGDEV